MAMYCIGDIQGCNTSLQKLLQQVEFSPSRDTLVVLGDMVNRGPDSLAVLRFLSGLGDSAQCILGNHDLHLLGVWQGVRKTGKGDTLQSVLDAPDALALLHWLRHRPMALYLQGWLLVHAGVLPGWSLAQTLALAAEVEDALRKKGFRDALAAIYGSHPNCWSDSLAGADRLRVIVNALTRLRFCTTDGSMDFAAKDHTNKAPAGFLPWFEVPGRATQDVPIAFGHWSTLYKDPHCKVTLHNQALPLDTGCVWGGRLTAARLDAVAGEFTVFSTECPPAAAYTLV